MIPFEEIPTNFVLNTLTSFQKEIIQIGYYIKLALDKCVGDKSETYWLMTQKLDLTIHRIIKLAKKLPIQVDSPNQICPACKTEFRLKPQPYWSYFDSNKKVSILCRLQCVRIIIKVKNVKRLTERRFYYNDNESQGI